jgi:hypothetical protein
MSNRQYKRLGFTLDFTSQCKETSDIVDYVFNAYASLYCGLKDTYNHDLRVLTLTLHVTGKR